MSFQQTTHEQTDFLQSLRSGQRRGFFHETNAIAALAFRDLLKFLRDPVRMISTFVFPLIFIGVLGGSFEASLGDVVGYSFLTFTFTGVLAQTLFQSSAMGLISLIEDRENDFSQEIFVSPISRYSIIFGKVLGESLVSMAQGLGIVAFAAIIGIDISLRQILMLGPALLIVCLFGGAFGVIIMSLLNSQRAANQVFPFVMLPQFFLAGVFTPITQLPWFLDLLSRLSPMRYAVDLTRAVFYQDRPDASEVVLAGAGLNLAIIAGLFALFLVAGTYLFVRKEQNR
ncbi:MAG TPA: ABC transporter permease [Anaerolineae bacterium]|nr:ABC transporter permease [Anaerolineae bacterium]